MAEDGQPVEKPKSAGHHDQPETDHPGVDAGTPKSDNPNLDDEKQGDEAKAEPEPELKPAKKAASSKGSK